METKYKFMIPFFALLLIIGTYAITSSIQPSENENIIGINYQGDVCVTVTRAEGTVEPTQCSSNTLYDTGAEAIEDYLGDGTGGNDAFDWIILCNATSGIGGTGCGVPAAAKTENYTALGGCGMDNVTGTVGDNANGNWSVWNEFTSSCDNIETNVTRLRNDDDDDLAGNNFTLVTLQNGDKLTVNWTISVS